MGDFLSGILGTNSQYQANPYQAGNPYSREILQQDVNNQAQIYGNQTALAQVLADQMSGKGPNPAQTLYNQNVQQNVANAQGLLSGQRGLNPALAAKLGSNIGAQANQQAASNSALLNQQQQLGATQNLGNLYGQMQQGNIAQQQLYNQANLGAMQTNANVAAGNQKQASGIVGGILGSAGAALGLARGGLVPSYENGGMINSGMDFDYSSLSNPKGIGPQGPQSAAGKLLSAFASNMGQTFGNESNPLQQGFMQFGKGLGSRLSKGPDLQLQQNVNDLSSFNPTPMGEMQNINPSYINQAHGGAVKNFKPGGYVPGKANIHGDSLSNDTVPAMVSPGEIVIPRSISQSKDAVNNSAKFVAAVLAKKSMGKKK